jgi:hypothetical protein
MKMMMKPVDMLAWFDAEGNPHPIRFRLKSPEGEDVVIRIDYVSASVFEKSGGNHMLRYECRATHNGALRLVQIRYEIGSCRWYLSKI